MTLDILINHYHESNEIINDLLDSLDKQIGIENKNIRVIICNDGNDLLLDEKRLQNHGFVVEYYIEPHKGVCSTRNFLLSKANADYIMFCDGDDCFYNRLGLYILFMNMQHGFDVIASNYVQEVKDESGFVYIPMIHDPLRVHGKVFKLDYVKEKKLTFPDEMKTTGDMYFLWQALNFTKNLQWVNDSFYLWRWNDDSVTRKTKWYKVSTYYLVMKNYTLLTEHLFELGEMNYAYILIANLILSAYIDLNSECFKSAPADQYVSAEKSCAKYLYSYKKYYDIIDLQLKCKQYSVACKSRHTPNGPEGGFWGVNSWIDMVMKKYPEYNLSE